MKTKQLVGTWLVSQTYVDRETKFLLTQTDRFFGTFSDAYEQMLFNINAQDIRIQYYSPDDVTSS